MSSPDGPLSSSNDRPLVRGVDWSEEGFEKLIIDIDGDESSEEGVGGSDTDS